MNKTWNIIIDQNDDLIDVVPTETVECWIEKGWAVLGKPTNYFNASEQADLIASLT